MDEAAIVLERMGYRRGEGQLWATDIKIVAAALTAAERRGAEKMRERAAEIAEKLWRSAEQSMDEKLPGYDELQDNACAECSSGICHRIRALTIED